MVKEKINSRVKEEDKEPDEEKLNTGEGAVNNMMQKKINNRTKEKINNWKGGPKK
jgi:hypothetical protein